jgi:hypothetical protein
MWGVAVLFLDISWIVDHHYLGTVVVVILWLLDLQLPMQSVDVTTNVVSSNPIQAICTLCDKVCQWLPAGRWFSLGTPVSSTNKTDRHDIAEILLKVALNTITITPNRHHYLDFLFILEIQLSIYSI